MGMPFHSIHSIPFKPLSPPYKSKSIHDTSKLTMSNPPHPPHLSSAAARAVQQFGNKLPIASKDVKSFFGALQGWNITVPFSEANANAFFSQYLTEVLVPSILEIEKALQIDDEAINSLNTTGLNPNKLINITLSRTLYTQIEMLWLISLRPRVLKDAKYPEQAETHFPTSLVLSADVLKGMKQSTLLLHVQDILPIVHAIDTIINHDRFAAFMRDRHLERVILTYFTLMSNNEVSSSSSSNINNNPSPSAIAKIEQRLKELLVHPPSLSFQTQCVTVLRSVTRCGSEKVKRLSAKYLTQILLSEQGLVAIMQGYLEGLVDSPMLSTMQIQLAKSLATLPADLSAEEYLRNICDQMIALWPVGLRENDKTLLTTLVFIVTRCTQVFPSRLLTDFFYRPMLLPLLSIVNGECQTSKSSLEKNNLPTLHGDHLLATREQVGQSLHFLVNFLSLSPPFSFVAAVMEELDIPMIITQLFLDSYCLNNPESRTKSVSGSYHMVQEWSEDILRRLFTMKKSLISDNFMRSLSLLQFTIANSDQITTARILPWIPKGQFQIHNDQSIDIVRLAAATHDTKTSEILHHQQPDPSIANISLNDIISPQISEASDSLLDVHQDTLVTPLLQYWKTQSLFAQHVSAWLYLLQKLETYRYEGAKPSANKRPVTSSSSSSSTLANKTKEDTVILQLTGCLSQCFVAVLDLYFSTSTSTSSSISSSIEEVETPERISTVRVAVVVQRCLEEVPLNLLLCDGVSILRLLHAIIQNAAVMGVVIEHAEDGSSLESTAISGADYSQNKVKNPSLIQEIIHDPKANQTNQQITQQEKQEINPTSSSALDLALNILSSLLLFNAERRSEEEEAQLQAMIPDLLSLATQQSQEPTSQTQLRVAPEQDTAREQRLEVAQRASDLALTIFKRRLLTDQKSHNKHKKGDVSDLDEALDRFISSLESPSATCGLQELYMEARALVSRIAQSSVKGNDRASAVETQHETAATRAFALCQLSLLMTALPFENDKENDCNNETETTVETLVLSVWREAMCLALLCLSDEDSFVYLNATLCLQRLLRCVLQAPRHSSRYNAGDGAHPNALRLKKNVHIHLAAVLICCFSGVDRYREVFDTLDVKVKPIDTSAVSVPTETTLTNHLDTGNDTSTHAKITVLSSRDDEHIPVSQKDTPPSSSSSSASFFLKPRSTTYKQQQQPQQKSVAPSRDTNKHSAPISGCVFLSDTVLAFIEETFYRPLQSIATTEKLSRWRVMVGEVLCQVLRHREDTTAMTPTGYLAVFQADERRLLQGLTAIVLRELKRPSPVTSSHAPATLRNNETTSRDIRTPLSPAPAFDVFSGRSLPQKNFLSSQETHDDTPSQDTKASLAEEDNSYYYQSTAQLYFQQSCLSILSEVLPLLGVAGHSVLHDIVHLCIYILRYETPLTQLQTHTTQSNNAADQHQVVLQRGRRRAAISLLRSIAEHYLPHLLHRDSVHYLTEIGGCLEIVLLQDHDEVVQYQAECTAEILQRSVGATIGLSI